MPLSREFMEKIGAREVKREGALLVVRGGPDSVTAAYDPSQPRHPKGDPMGGQWRSLSPGDRVAVVQTGPEGTVERVNVPEKGQSQGLGFVRVRWDESGESSRVSNPGMNLAVPGPPRSEGHLLFAGRWEYFVFGDDVLRAPIDAPIRVDVPFRNGARFEFPLSQLERRREQGIYPFEPVTLFAAGFDEAKVKRWPTGTRVGGAKGGGRFAPKDSAGDGKEGGAKKATTEKGSTEELYRDPETGEWDPERVKLHDGIRELFEEHGKPQAEPVALFMAGGSGSGKDTVLKMESELAPPDAVVVDPDEVKSRLPEYRQMVQAGDPDAGPFVHEESSYVAKQIARDAIVTQSNVVINGTGDSGEKGAFYSKIVAAREAGYTTEVVVVDVDADSALERAQGRGQRTGRVVRESDLREIHRHVSAQHAEWRDKVDTWRAFANDGAPGEHTVMAYREGGGEIVVVDQGRYDEFLAKAKG